MANSSRSTESMPKAFGIASLLPCRPDIGKAFSFPGSVSMMRRIRENPVTAAQQTHRTRTKYPFLTCEIGGGMMSSYHRRILFNPKDAEATTLVKLGSGSTLLGYYMYHGGGNPEGKLSTLMESQATKYWNDMPVKNYDFQAPIGEYGQIREQYHLLRRLHLFLHEWGPVLADMPATLPDEARAARMMPTLCAGAFAPTAAAGSFSSTTTSGFACCPRKPMCASTSTSPLATYSFRKAQLLFLPKPASSGHSISTSVKASR